VARYDQVDCVVVGYNSTPIDEYAEWVRTFGEDSEAFRDLQYSCVNLGRRPLGYTELFNEALDAAGRRTRLVACGIPNLAAVYLTQFLRRSGLCADFVSSFRTEQARLDHLLACEPRVLAVTTTLYLSGRPVKEIADYVRAKSPTTKVVAGGPLICNHLRDHQGLPLWLLLRETGADLFVTDAQGEATLARLTRALRDGDDLASVPNLAWISGPTVAQTSREPEGNDLNRCAVRWDEIDPARLGPTLAIRTARSCAFSCAFCNYPQRAGELTTASVDTVEAELDSAARSGAKNLVFIDDTFNVPLPRFKDICRAMIRKGHGFSWYSYLRCSQLDEEAVHLMRDSGCRAVFLGIESASDDMLRRMAKKAVARQYYRGIEWLKNAGIQSFASFIVGFPGETEESVRETERFVECAEPEWYRAQLWYNEPGTPISQQGHEYNLSGTGFVWRHDSMDSEGAMDLIDRLFLTVRRSTWLPQWEFDFWALPYLDGLGIDLGLSRRALRAAQKLLELNVVSTTPEERRIAADDAFHDLVVTLRGAPASSSDAPAGRMTPMPLGSNNV
jgi:p-methyltransferase